MGSLLPGWDESAPGVAPKGFQEFSDEDEQLGYFASYERMKREQRDTGDLSRTSAPLGAHALSRRNSMPISLGRRSLPLKDGGPMSPGSRSFKESPDFGAFRAPQRLQRLTSMPVTAGERVDLGTPKALVSPKSPGSFAAGSPGSPSLEQYKAHKEQQHEVQWWRNFDSAALNEMPDVPHEKDKGFVPQFIVAGQKMHFRGLEEGGEDTGT